MMELHGCPRCNGAVVQHGPSSSESDTCVNCGWLRPEIPEEVMEMVQAQLGKP